MRHKHTHRVSRSVLIATAMFVSLDTLARAQSVGPVTNAPSIATSAAPSDSAARGVVGTIEITYSGGTLRAKPLRDTAAPMLVRVVPIGDPAAGKFRIEYLGLVSGQYDLSTLIELDNGRPAEGLAPILVQVQTQLPKEHGTDVFGLSSPGLWLGAHYRLLMGVLAVVWVLVPIIIVGRNLARRKPREIPPPPAREPTPAELLGDLVAIAEQRELTGTERGKLELLLLRVLRERDGASTETPGQLAGAIVRLRSEPRTANIVRSVEHWLHAGAAAPDRASDAASAAIAELRAMKSMSPMSPATSPEGGAR